MSRPCPIRSNDARAIAKSLRDIGFTVTEGIDLDRAAMQSMTREFLREAARAQVAVVYYAGHGVQIDGRNYLVPVDIQFQSGTDVTDSDDGHGYDHGRPRRPGPHQHPDPRCLPQQSDGAEGCFCGPEPRHRRRHRSGSGLAAPTSLGAGSTLGAGTLIAFATAPGQVALDGEGANSPFSAALSRHIGTPGLEVQQMLTRVRAEVVAATEIETGAVVEFVAARRGLSGGEVRSRARCYASPRDAATLTSPTPRWRLRPRAAAWPTALPRTGCCLPRSRQSRIAATPRAGRAARTWRPPRGGA